MPDVDKVSSAWFVCSFPATTSSIFFQSCASIAAFACENLQLKGLHAKVWGVKSLLISEERWRAKNKKSVRRQMWLEKELSVILPFWLRFWNRKKQKATSEKDSIPFSPWVCRLEIHHKVCQSVSERIATVREKKPINYSESYKLPIRLAVGTETSVTEAHIITGKDEEQRLAGEEVWCDAASLILSPTTVCLWLKTRRAVGSLHVSPM